MKKIIVIGCPGGGKSTFARALHSKTGIALYYLDMMNWNADRTTVEKNVFRERLSNVLRLDSWIIDGNYASTMEQRLSACDTVFFLDYLPNVCLEGIRQRFGKPRADMPWIETEEDPEFMEFIKNYKEQQRSKVLELLSKYKDGRRIVIFKHRQEADAFLKTEAQYEG